MSVDPTEELWNIIMFSAFISLPLLDRDNTSEIYQVINLPIPYSRVEQSLGANAKYKIETEFIALNLTRTKSVINERRGKKV